MITELMRMLRNILKPHAKIERTNYTLDGAELYFILGDKNYRIEVKRITEQINKG